MWIMVDSLNVVTDKASVEGNLSRGYTFPGYKTYEIDKIDIRIGDTYDGKNVTINTKLRAEKELFGVKTALVNVGVQVDKANTLGFADVETDFNTEKTTLEARKTELEQIIALSP